MVIFTVKPAHLASGRVWVLIVQQTVPRSSSSAACASERLSHLASPRAVHSWEWMAFTLVCCDCSGSLFLLLRCDLSEIPTKCPVWSPSFFEDRHAFALRAFPSQPSVQQRPKGTLMHSSGFFSGWFCLEIFVVLLEYACKVMSITNHLFLELLGSMLSSIDNLHCCFSCW